MQPAVIAIAERIETDLLNLYAQFTANAPVGTAGTPMTEAAIDAAETACSGQGSGERSRSTWWWMRTLIRRCARFLASANTTRRARRACGPWWTERSARSKTSSSSVRSLFRRPGTSPVNTHNLAFTKDAIGLVIRRLPQPLPGTGAVAEYAEMGNFGMRVVMSYQPNTLAQQFTVDVLYGCGVLRNNFAVQVNS